MSSHYRIILSSNPCDDILSSWRKNYKDRHICFQKSLRPVSAWAPTSYSNYIEPEQTHRVSWLGKRRSCSEFSISRSASKVWVKIEAALQGSTMEERVQTILWALGLLHNETLCAFEAHFSWEPAKLSSRGVALKDFLHNCLLSWNRSAGGVGVQQYDFLLQCEHLISGALQATICERVSSAMHEMETQPTAAENAESEHSVEIVEII